MNEQETITDIIAEMRFHGQQNIDAEKDKPEYGILTVEGRITKHYADRLEAAHERERGNEAKLREALKRAWLFVSSTRESFAFVHEGRIDRDKLCDDIDAALATTSK